MPYDLCSSMPFLAALVFGPAGSFRFWQGWVFLSAFLVFSAIFGAYFYRHDPGLLERRLQHKEPRHEQKIFKVFWMPLWIITLALPGFDYRFGWSSHLAGGVPLWLTGVSWAISGLSWYLVFHVMRFNSFASAIVQVEAGQKVIMDGPYLDRVTPNVFGLRADDSSFSPCHGVLCGLVPALLLIPLLVYRLRDEERLLQSELPGYTEYCERTRFRLIPSVF